MISSQITNLDNTLAGNIPSFHLGECVVVVSYIRHNTLLIRVVYIHVLNVQQSEQVGNLSELFNTC